MDGPLISWEEIKKHQAQCSRWIVIGGKVYDVTSWQNRHPGGRKIISHYAAQDATEAFIAFHKPNSYAEKYLKPYFIGYVNETTIPKADAEKIKERKQYFDDFECVRKTLVQKGLFEANLYFFGLMFLQVVVFEAIAYLNLKFNGTGWIRTIISIISYSIAQGQASWLQHDLGHLSVFKSNKFNHLFHEYVLGFTKGASCHWWNYLHSQHHAKPNVIDKDPDIRLEPVFVIGDKLPVRAASKESSWKWHLPYQYQHKYFFFIGPPLLFPVYFQIMSFRHIFVHKRYEDFLWVMGFFAKLFILYYPLFGFWGTVAYFLTVRVIESHWFTWVSQSNHLSMPVEPDKEESWLQLQLHGTCNVENSLFNDWFTGHLNYQIEHHLFPTMPRHNYHKARPYVQELCRKYNIVYQIKPIGIAFKDVVRSLKKAALLWKKVTEKENST